MKVSPPPVILEATCITKIQGEDKNMEAKGPGRNFRNGHMYEMDERGWTGNCLEGGGAGVKSGGRGRRRVQGHQQLKQCKELKSSEMGGKATGLGSESFQPPKAPLREEDEAAV